MGVIYKVEESPFILTLEEKNISDKKFIHKKLVTKGPVEEQELKPTKEEKEEPLWWIITKALSGLLLILVMTLFICYGGYMALTVGMKYSIIIGLHNFLLSVISICLIFFLKPLWNLYNEIKIRYWCYKINKTRKNKKN